MKQFDEIYAKNLWNNSESRSGRGSSFEWAKEIMPELVYFVQESGISSFLDLPCGDFNWMQHIVHEIPGYIGADCVKDLIFDNRKKYEGVDFRVLDVTRSELPDVDMILCRDCLVHLCNEDVDHAVANLQSNNAIFYAITSFPGAEKTDIETGKWRAIDMDHYFGPPLIQIKEKAAKKYLNIYRA